MLDHPAGVRIGTARIGTTGTTYDTDVTTFIQALVGNSSSYAGFQMFEPANPDDFGTMTFLAPGSGSSAPALGATARRRRRRQAAPGVLLWT